MRKIVSSKYFILILLYITSILKAQISISGCYISGVLADPGSTAGCGNSGTNNYCNLASLYVPAFTPTACSTFTSSGGVSHIKGTVYSLPAGCTATIEAEFKKRNYLGVGSTSTGCSNSGMDGSPDGFAITQSGGVIVSQFSQIDVNVGTCGSYPVLGTYTTAVATLSPGCNNADGYIRMELTGGTFTVGGTSNRADEVITFTINLSGTCGPSCSNVLPLELMAFYGVPDNNKVILAWRVASETNVEYYLVERSIDVVNWSEVIKVPASSETFGTNKNYSTQDHYPQKGINYYRLTNYDKNGERGGSSVITVNFVKEAIPIWIEQTNEDIIVNFNSVQVMNEVVELYDISGRLVHKLIVAEGISKVFISKQHLAQGLYSLKAVSNEKIKFTKLIIH